VSDPEQTQLKETYAIAQKHLCELKHKRDEMDEVIADLEEQIKWGERILRASGSTRNAADNNLNE
jgi:hypothetical protein